MKGDQLASRMLPQTCNLMSSGGSAFEAITAGDIQGLLRSIDATPLIWSFFEAKYKIQPKAQFQEKLVCWMHNRLLNQRHLKPEYIAKNHINAVFAAHDLAEGLAGYLARHKVADDALGPWFDIEKSKFSRYYAPFIRECVADLEHELGRLERAIHERTKYHDE